MTNRLTAFGIVVSASLLAGCPTSTDNGNGTDGNGNVNGDVVAEVPKGTDCGAVAIACYDEFAHQPANVICFREASRWANTELTWRLTERLPGVGRDEQEEVAGRAFQLWADASGLSFSSGGAGADVNISFGAGDHGDPFPFDGPGNNLGHAFFPGSGNPGAIHLCSIEDWGLTSGAGSFDLFTAMVHEIGHALGVEHSLREGAVMSPRYTGPISELTDDDVEAIQRLYGSSDGDVPPIIERGEAFEEFCADAMANLTALGDPDTDGDGIPDTVEFFVLNTEPLEGDSDGDNVTDFVEVFVDTTDPGDSTDFEPDSVLSPPDTTDASLTAQLLVDGVEVESFAVGDGSLIGAAPEALGANGYQLLIQTGSFALLEITQIVILFDDVSDIDGTPIPAGEFRGLLQLAATAPVSIVAQFCENFQSDFAGACIGGDASGEIELNLIGGRLVGSFDFSIVSPLDSTLRAVGELDLPEMFSQASESVDVEIPDLGG